MELSDRLKGFSELGQKLRSLGDDELDNLTQESQNENPWFTPENVMNALSNLHKFLKEENLQKWVENYNIEEKPPLPVGVVMAGNIPLVGFHDFLAVLISGNKILMKRSHQDSYLIGDLASQLIAINPAFETLIEFREQIPDARAIIATGSDNSARYFKYYFSRIPCLIRQNRTSCAVLNGSETEEDLVQLGKDIFSYFGLGCRNVSKIYIPEDYDLSRFMEELAPYRKVIDHYKYANNYDYQKAIFLVNGEVFNDNGFLLARENSELVSPLSVLYFEPYRNTRDLEKKIDPWIPKIQCIISRDGWFHQEVSFGKSQEPELWDYADQIDTLDFLTNLS